MSDTVLRPVHVGGLYEGNVNAISDLFKSYPQDDFLLIDKEGTMIEMRRVSVEEQNVTLPVLVHKLNKENEMLHRRLAQAEDRIASLLQERERMLGTPIGSPEFSPYDCDSNF